MALETVRTYEVEIKGANSVKELKQEISDLRDKLVQLDKDSDAYDKTVEDLIADETKLKEVMTAGKDAVSAQTGSYNALVNEMSALKKVWRQVTDEAKRAEIGAKIKAINDQLKEMDASIGNNQRKVGSYEEALNSAFMNPRQQIRKLREELAHLTVGTKEYNAVFQQLAQLTMEQKKLNENLAFSSSDLGDIFTNLAGVARGVVGGFSAMQAAVGLFGDGNEDLQEAMLRTQRIIALMQGLEGLEGLGDRIKGLSEGMKTFITRLFGGTSGLKDFSNETKAAGGNAVNAANSMNTNAGAASNLATETNIAADAMERFNEKLSNNVKVGESVKEELNEKTNAIDDYMISLAQATRTKQVYIDSENKFMMVLENGERATFEASKQMRENALQNTKYATTIVGLQDKLKGLHKWQVLSRLAAKAQIKENQALMAGNMGVATTAKIATVALKGFKAALAATGIGLLIIGLGELLNLLGKGFSALSGWITGATKWKNAAEDLKTANEELTKQLEAENDALDFEVRKMEAAGATYEEVYEAKRKNTQEHLRLVAAQLADAEAAWATIKPKNQQKKKYAEFREELEKLRETYNNLNTELRKIDEDKIVHDIQVQTDAEKERVKAAEDAAKQAQKIRDDEMKKAADLYKQTLEYWKDEKTKLKEKYDAEKALLEKYGLSTVALTLKYEKEKTDIVLKELKARYDYFRQYNARQNSLLEENTLAYYQNILDEAKEMQEDITEIVTMDAGGATVKGEDRDWFNAKYGLDLKTTQDFVQQVAIANKAVDDAEKKLNEFTSTNAMEALTKRAEIYSKQMEDAVNRATLNYEKLASESAFKGFYSGLSPKDLRRQMDETYAIQQEGLQKQIDLYREASNQKNLTDADRAAVLQQLNELELQMGDLQTQHIIDQNNLVIESYNNMVDSIQSIASSLTDILGSVADMMIDNAERAYEAGDITKEAYEQQFEDAKKIQIAQAIINTIAGALGAFMGITKDTGGWGIAAAAAEAAAILTAGFLQVEQIRNTKPSSSNSSSDKGYAVAVPTVTDFNPQPVVNATGESETENLANALSSTPLKAYVVESDITDAQNKATKRKNESTF